MTRPHQSHSIEVALRDIAAADLETFFEHQRDPDACRMAAFPSRDREAFMAHWAKILADPSVIKKAIICNAELAGNVVSFQGGDQRLLGYWIGKEYWGKGTASAAVAKFLSHEPIRPLHARVAKQNLGSIRVLEKCGFKVCGEDRFTTPCGLEMDEFVMWID